MSRIRIAALNLALLLSVVPRPSMATFHLVKIVEVFPGTSGQPDAQYVMLQMYAAFQNFVASHGVTVFDASGNEVANIVFPSSVNNGANQATILIGTAAMASLFGVAPDFAMPAALTPAGGKVCYEAIDCVSWGDSTSSATLPSPSGTPFNQAGGLVLGMAMQRNSGIDGDPSSLGFLDDTNDSQHDFVFAAPIPKNNAGMTGTLPAPATPTATSTEALPTATATPSPPPAVCVGDCDGSGDVTVDELVTLVNIDLGVTDASACPSGLPGGAGVDIALIVRAVGEALNSCP